MYLDGLYEFRISKYDKNYTKSAPLIDQWTSISDVGKLFGDQILTWDEYEKAEKRYLQLIHQVCSTLNISQLQVTFLEDPFGECPYPNNSFLDGIDQVVEISKDCLRERYWCKLQSDCLFFHFGYDYYLYVGSHLNQQQLSSLASSVGLFIERKRSPYN